VPRGLARDTRGAGLTWCMAAADTGEVSTAGPRQRGFSEVAREFGVCYDTVMATKELPDTEQPVLPDFNWDGITAEPTERLKKRKVVPVPASIIKQAQRSYDGVDGKHVLHYTFPTEEIAAAFVKHMRNAGEHTTPPTSVSAAIDPDETGDKRHVAWRAGKRRGRNTDSA
jgi:hypothetical protein